MPRQAVINYPRVAASGRQGVLPMNASLRFNGAGFGDSYVATTYTLAPQGAIFTRVKLAKLFNYNTLWDTSAGGNNWETWVYSVGWVGTRPSAGGATLSTPLNAMNRWVTLCVTWGSSGFYKLYVNGKFVSSTPFVDVNSGTTFYWGGGNIANTSGNCWMSDGRIYSTELSAQQVLSLSTSGIDPVQPDVKHQMGEGAGGIVYDSSGNGRNGIITNCTWSADVPSKKRGVVGGNMVPNGDMSFVPVVNVPQTANGNRWLDGTAGGSISNYLFSWALSTNIIGSSSAMFDRNVKSPSGGNSIKVSTLAINSVGQVTTSAVDPITGAAVLSKPAFAVKPNTSYTYMYLMRTELVSGASNNGANILWKERNVAGSNTVINGNEVMVTANSEWTLYTGSFITASTTVNITPQPSVVGNTGAATLVMDAWFADIQLRPTVASGRVS